MTESTQTQTCPCGFEGADCEVITTLLESKDDAMNGLCDIKGFEKCHIWQNKALCGCKCGYIGEFCEVQVEPVLEAFGKLFFMYLWF